MEIKYIEEQKIICDSQLCYSSDFEYYQGIYQHSITIAMLPMYNIETATRNLTVRYLSVLIDARYLQLSS
jgi:hypothetical protein